MESKYITTGQINKPPLLMWTLVVGIKFLEKTSLTDSYPPEYFVPWDAIGLRKWFFVDENPDFPGIWEKFKLNHFLKYIIAEEEKHF